MNSTIIKSLIKDIENITGFKVEEYNIKSLDDEHDMWILEVKFNVDLKGINKTELSCAIMTKIKYWPMNLDLWIS